MYPKNIENLTAPHTRDNINETALLSRNNSGKIDRTPQQELLHQAHSYSLAIRGFIITSVLLYFVGIGSFVAGKFPEGTINTASESTLKILFVLVKLDRQNTDRLSEQFTDQD
ncbi:hypothetical protein QUB63_15060 [Microcoleus sp. ARI1-B5]|uniref:hypothetical protein n=1 Tax=unclassified Microcoleus TaxID=2642155 RepID=UPI002FCF9578